MEELSNPFIGPERQQASFKGVVLMIGFLLGGSQVQSLALFSYVGILLGCIFLVLVALANYQFTQVIIRSCRHTHERSYFGFIDTLFELPVRNFFLVMFLLISLGQISIFQEIQLAYLRRIAIDLLIVSEAQANENYFEVIIMISVGIPVYFLASTKNINDIWYCGAMAIFFAVCSTGVLAVSIILNWDQCSMDGMQLVSPRMDGGGMGNIAIGICYSIYMMEAYAPIPCIYKENLKYSMKKTFSTGFMYAVIIYIVLGVVGYLASNCMNISEEIKNLEVEFFVFIKIRWVKVIMDTLYVLYLAGEIILYLQPAWLFTMQLIHGSDFYEEDDLTGRLVIALLLFIMMFISVFHLIHPTILSVLSVILYIFIVILCLLCLIYVRSYLKRKLAIIGIALFSIPMTIYGLPFMIEN